jgi:hypothetical protein
VRPEALLTTRGFTASIVCRVPLRTIEEMEKQHECAPAVLLAKSRGRGKARSESAALRASARESSGKEESLA